VRYLSVCSGIEAASVAWHALGWQPLAFSEIEPFPRAVLAHHYPDTPLHGDFTVLREQDWIVDADVLVGGTPCQAFSVAGLRNSLADDRGNLSLEFVRLADAIDDVRHAAGKPPAIIVWENVPGVLSVRDNAFGCFLAALAGDVTPIDPPRGKWSNAGVVDGPQRTVAWRVLDAQYFGLAQRRRRVFVVSSARDGFDPAAVLLEFEGVRRDTAPRRETGKVAPTIPARSLDGGGLRTDFDCDGGVIKAFAGTVESDVAATIQTTCHDYSRADGFNMIAHTLKGEGFDASEDGTGRGTPLVPVAYSIMPQNSGKDYKARPVEVAQPIMAGGPVGGNQGGDYIMQPVLSNDPAHAICANEQRTYTNEGSVFQLRNVVAQPVAVPLLEVGKRTGVSTDDSRAGIGIGQDGDPMFTLQAGAQHGVATAIPFDTTQITSPSNYSRPKEGDPCHPLAAGAHPPAVAVSLRGRDGGGTAELGGDIQNALRASQGGGDKPHVLAAVATVTGTDIMPTLTRRCDGSQTGTGNGMPIASIGMAVRRLTPVECERLQGFPDDYTLIPWKKKPAEQCPDGPRYKALGNSMAVPVMRWIGTRIAAALASSQLENAA
jgi:DNA (cytosine-5)-methyltransferase 1